MTHRICRRAVNLGRVFAAEGTTAMTSHTTIGINDDLAACEAGIAHGAPCDKTARRVDKNLCRTIEQVSRNDGLDDMLDNVQANLLLIYVVRMLR